MKIIHAIWKDGRIVPIQPVNWPEVTALTIEPAELAREDEVARDLLGEDPDSIARWIAAFDALPPFRMSESEESEWHAARRSVKDRTVTKMQDLSIEDRP